MVRTSSAWSAPVRVSPQVSGPVKIGELLPAVLAHYGLLSVAKRRESSEQVARRAWKLARESMAELSEATS
jgi:hypothetical protein